MSKTLLIRFCLTLILILAFANIFAQEEVEKNNLKNFSFSANVGMSFSRVLPLEHVSSGWINYETYSINADNGLFIGISGTQRFGDVVLLELGLNVEHVSYNINYRIYRSDYRGSRINTHADYIMQIGYIQPVIMPRIQFGEKVNIVFGFGLCFNIPIITQISGDYSKVGQEVIYGGRNDFNTVLNNNEIENNPRFFYEPIVNLKMNFPISNHLVGVGVSYKTSLSYYISNAGNYDSFARDQIITTIYYNF